MITFAKVSNENYEKRWNSSCQEVIVKIIVFISDSTCRWLTKERLGLEAKITHSETECQAANVQTGRQYAVISINSARNNKASWPWHSICTIILQLLYTWKCECCEMKERKRQKQESWISGTTCWSESEEIKHQLIYTLIYFFVFNRNKQFTVMWHQALKNSTDLVSCCWRRRERVYSWWGWKFIARNFCSLIQPVKQHEYSVWNVPLLWMAPRTCWLIVIHGSWQSAHCKGP